MEARGAASCAIAGTVSANEHIKASAHPACLITVEVYCARPSGFVGEQSVHKGLRIKGLHVLDAFPQTDQFDRQPEGVGNSQHHASASGAVEFG